MNDDDPLRALARRHHLSDEALRDLRTLLPSSTAGRSSAVDAPGAAGPAGDVRAPSDPGSSTIDGARVSPSTAAALGVSDDRYQVVDLLGRGGQGEVHRVIDHKLGRRVAMKLLRAQATTAARMRFRTETSVTVDLQHPGIVPVYDRGITADGRPWYTMQIIEGDELARLIADPEQPLRRLVDLFARACDPVAYAHERGVVHRDLKPGNVMIGAFGEVRVLDWGLARRAAARVSLADTDGVSESPFVTRAGAIMGTPRYMAPEQLVGAHGDVGPATDVYALGLILAEILTRQRPAGGSLEALRALRVSADLPPPEEGPEPLRALCAAMTRRDPAARPAHAGAVGAAARAWLDGVRRREQSAALVAAAEATAPTIAELRAEAEALDRQAAEQLEGVPAHAPVHDKQAGWALQDRAVERRRQARLAEVRLRQTLESALRLDPDSVAARDGLTAHYRARLLDAEAARDTDRAAELVALIEGHDRAGNVEWLRGDGAVTLLTDPPGAEVEVLRYEERDRRGVEVPCGLVARTPLVGLPLAMGSYLLKIRHPGRVEVRYPVNIERHGIWDGIPPDGTMAYAIPLPWDHAVAEGERYVPAGWCLLGGDPEAADGLPRHRAWVEGFVIGRHPVTHAAVLAWLDALVDAGAVGEAERWAPRLDSPGGQGVRPIYARGPGGRFVLGPAFGTTPAPDWPAVGLSARGATAFLQSQGAGLRLPQAWEWEKAARGVDGRAFAWGDRFVETYANVLNGRGGAPAMCSIGDAPLDASPYGVRHVTGNVRDLTATPYRRRGWPRRGGVHPTPPPVGELPDDAFVVVKGGAYTSAERACRAALRFGMPPDRTSALVGFRPCRALSEGAGS